jgi:hypothetical protein
MLRFYLQYLKKAPEMFPLGSHTSVTFNEHIVYWNVEIS